MWALVEDNAITKIINKPRGMVIGDVRYSKNIFSFRWTNEEREAIGIYEIVIDNSNKKMKHITIIQINLLTLQME